MPDLAVVPARPTSAPPRPLWGPTKGQGAHTVEGADWSRWHLVEQHLLEALGVYVPSDNLLEDNRRRLAAGVPIVRRGRW